MVWVEAAAAATKAKFKSMKKQETKKCALGINLMAAALALPGLLVVGTLPAHAESAPDKTSIGIKYLGYKDWQPGDPSAASPADQSGKRMKASSPSIYLLAPVGSQYSVEASATVDSVSGASPKYHNTLSGASSKGYINDKRTAFDVKATRYGEAASVGVGVSYSNENDYESKAISNDVRINSEDKNRTYAVGLSYASDTVKPLRINNLVVDPESRRKRTAEVLLGVTQVLTPVDLAQVNLTYSAGRGYFSDPYKNFYGRDERPDLRNQMALLVRYNHHFETLDASLRNTARYYKDSFGVKGFTLSADWAQELKGGWTVTPNLRYTSQSAANFYYDPPYPNGSQGSQYYSADTRLSAFGGITYGLKIEKEVGTSSKVDVKVEKYEQRGSWRLGGNGSTGLLPFHALFWQVGWNTKY